MIKRRSQRLLKKEESTSTTPSSGDSKHLNEEHYDSSEEKYSDNRGRPLHDRMHDVSRPSLLAHNSLVLNMRGFYNLFVIVVIVTNFQMLLKNIITYGSLIKLTNDLKDLFFNWQLSFFLLIMNSSIIIAFCIERFIAPLSHQPIGYFTIFIQISNCIFITLLPYYAVKIYRPDPLMALILLCCSIVWLFKLLSFHHVCYDIRCAIKTNTSFSEICSNKDEIEKIKKYPKCIKLGFLFRFIAMPTMCFQFYYPLTPRIRWVSLTRHIIEALACAALIKIIFEQYMLITLLDTFTIADLNTIKASHLFFHFLERMLRLSIPNLYIWLLLFMLVFHHWCNILAELTRFGDRLFYEDWWNASSLDEYWRRWNLPIYRFLNRHINKPLLSFGIPRFISSMIVFLISAMLHEYLISIPLQLGLIGIAFAAFLAQVPLIYLTRLSFFKRHRTIGNIFFWIIFCFSGQPIGILSYFYLWALKQGTVNQLEINRIYVS